MNSISPARVLLTGIALYAMVAASSSACAQELATLSGVVTEKGSGEVVIGAVVRLWRDSASIGTRSSRGAVTNRFGFFSIAKVPSGRYFVTVTSIGYAEHRMEIVVAEGDGQARIDIALEPSSVTGEQVVVTAERSRTPTTATGTVELRPSVVHQLPAIGGEADILRTLQLLPGVKSVSEISSGLYVRGGSPDQNLTLLDGVIVYNPSHLGGFLSTFNTDAVRDIKLIKGAFPAEYGGRLSSVLDLTMREGTKEKLSGSAGISLINSRLTLEGPITEDATFMVSGRRMYLDLLTPLVVDENEEVPSYYFYDLNAKTNYKISERDRIYASGYFGRDVLRSSGDASDRIDVSWGNITANLRWAHVVSENLFTNFSLIYTDYAFSTLLEQERDSAVVDGFKSASGIRDLMARGEMQYYANESHTIKAGIEATEHRFRADATAEIADFGRLESDPTVLTSIDASAYVQDEWTISPELSANVGGRLYYFQSGDYVRFEPRVSLAYTLNDQTTLKGAFALGNQFLHLITRNDISLPTDVWFPSTKTILPATGYQGVLGVETTFLDNEYLVTVEGYYRRMNNLLEYRDTASFSLDVPLESSFTSGSGEAYGVELFVNKRMGDLTGWVGYTLSWTTRTFPELNRGRTFYPRYDRRHDISVVVMYRLGESWELGATWVYGTGQAYTVPSGAYTFVDPTASYKSDRLDYTERNGYRLPPFHKLDLNFSHSFEWFDLPWKVSINIYNAYAHKNVFAQFVDTEYEFDPQTGQERRTYKLKRFTLFPFIPTFGLSVRF